MYTLSNAEFMQFKIAGKRLKELQQQHAMELQEAYDNIHPTRTGVDYGTGRMYSESVDPADYAIYLVDLQENHKEHQKWWLLRYKAYKQAMKELSPKEQNDLLNFKPGNFIKQNEANEKLRKALNKIVDNTPMLQRSSILLDELDDMEEVDELIENMSEDELLEGYEDPLDGEHTKKRCIKLYKTHDMNFREISEIVGVTFQRAKRIIKQYT